MGLGWGLAGVVLIGFGSLADLITVPRALDLATLVAAGDGRDGVGLAVGDCTVARCGFLYG
jgi:hypothetical protein